jgi:glycosyltransferase involved in cell wall biosynthesis
MNTIGLISHSVGLQGAEKMLLNLSILLKSSNRFYPLLFIPDSVGPLYDEAKRHGIRCLCYQPAPWHISQINLNSFPVIFRESYESLKNALNENPCDLILVNTHVSIVPVNIAISLDVPLIIWCHGIIDASMVEPTYGFSHLLNQWLLSAGSKLVVVSKWTGEYYRSFYGVEDYSLLPNWLPSETVIDSFQEKYRSGKFVCLGSHEDIKGIDVLINAAIEINRRGCKFEIDLFGNGPLHKQLQKKVNENFLAHRIHFYGFVSSTKDVYADKLCVISPSYVDSFGLTVIEGMANKTPVIATRAGGPEEVIKDGFTGVLIDRGDHVALADKMEFFLNNPNEAQRMGENGYTVFQERYSEKVARETVYSILDETMVKYKGYNSDKKLIANLLLKFTDYFSKSTINTQPQKHVNWRSSVRLESGLVYSITPNNCELSGLGILIKVDNPSKPLTINMTLRLSNGQTIRKSKAIISEYGHEMWISFKFIPLKNIRAKKIVIELVPDHLVRNVIRVYETNDFEAKMVRVYRRIMGLLRIPAWGNQLCFIEL